jgi:hypothetical protein
MPSSLQPISPQTVQAKYPELASSSSACRTTGTPSQTDAFILVSTKITPSIRSYATHERLERSDNQLSELALKDQQDHSRNVLNFYNIQKCNVPTTSGIPVTLTTMQGEELVLEKELRIPRPFAAESGRVLVEGKGVLAVNDACSSRGIESQESFDSPSADKLRKVSSVSRRVSPSLKESMGRNNIRIPLTSAMKRQRRTTVGATGSGKFTGFLLLVMLSILGVAQALTGCQIMNDWLPKRFTGVGIACCDQDGITCVGGNITEMYINF